MNTAPNPSSGADSRQHNGNAGGDLMGEGVPGRPTSSGAGGGLRNPVASLRHTSTRGGTPQAL